MKSPYTEFLESKTEAELSEIAHIKRFLECFTGDNKFRELVKAGEKSLQELGGERGCNLSSLESLRPVFDTGYAHFRKEAKIETWPLTAKWDEFHKKLLNTLPFYTLSGDSDGEFKEFDEWRQKQMVRTVLDVGPAANYITHPPIAFEISDGCSVGCWFCGISAEKFGGHFQLENGGADFWRETLEAAKSVIGSGMSTGFCYWATEPLDHPDYDKFLATYFDIIGVIPQTTTAIPLRDITLTRKVLKFWEKSRFVPNRFSVLSTSIMNRIHSEFPPEELLGVEMVMQGKDSTNAKSIAGRAFEKEGEIDKKNRKFDNMLAGTIACVTGFLVNLPKRTVRLVSPTLPSEKWPNGYYIFASNTFETPDELASVMREMVMEQSCRSIDSNKPINLSPNHWFEKEGQNYTIRDNQFGFSMDIFSVIGPMLQSAECSPNQILKHAISQGHDPILVLKVISDLTNLGMIGDALRPKQSPVSLNS